MDQRDGKAMYRLDLSQRSIGSELGLGTATVGFVIEKYIAPHKSTLTHIDLSRNNIRSEGAIEMMAYAAAELPELRVLDLSLNKIDDDSLYGDGLVEALVGLCVRGPVLERVKLSGNDVICPAWLARLTMLCVVDKVDPKFLRSVEWIRRAVCESEGSARACMLQRLGL
jgi:hypothetical protein